MKNSEIIKINTVAARLYHHILVDTKAGKKAMKYLHSRKVNDATINAYELGWAPKKSVLVRYFSKHGVTAEQLRATGLTAEGKSGKLYDRFFSRIIYPIDDRHGHVIAFSGRVLNKKDSPAKYLNIPETQLFHKRETIFNLDKAMKAIKKEHHVILVEGYMDVISAYQAGVKNVIASMGTSLTKEQISKIKAITPNVTVCYDGDKPGQNAIARAMRILSGKGIHRTAIQMPKGVDPDEYRRANGNQDFRAYMKHSVEAPTSFWLNHWSVNVRKGDSLSELTFLAKAVHTVSGFTMPGYCPALGKALLKQHKYAKEISKNMNIPENDIFSSIVHDNYKDSQNLNVLIGKAECALIKTMLDRPALLAKFNVAKSAMAPKYAKLTVVLKDYYRKHGHVNTSNISKIAERLHLSGTLKQIAEAKPTSESNLAAYLYAGYINKAQTVQKSGDMFKRDLKLARQMGDISLTKALIGKKNILDKAVM